MSGAARQTGLMITITVKWDVKPEYADKFMDLVDEFTRACRAEPGCLSFEVTQSGDSMIWRVAERFADRAAFDAHQTRTRASDWWAATAAIRREFRVSRGR